MKVLLYGGSFNPVHNAHLLCAREAMEQCNFAEVIFVPTADHPFKSNLIPFEHRWSMLKIAIAGERHFDISSIEAERKGKSYTIDTVENFIQAGFSDVYWLIGEDNAGEISTWKRYEELCKKVKFLVVNRPGYEPCDIPGAQITRVTIPRYEISSSQVRDRMKNNKSISYLVPDQVAEYMKEHKLYK